MVQTDTISWWQTSLDQAEKNAVVDAIAAGHLSEGAECADFERQFAKFLGVPYAVAAPNGTSALLMSMLALGVGPGDEVIVPDHTWIATAHAAVLLGAKIVLVDTTKERPVIDAEEVRQHITSRTKAIIPVHLGGRMANIRSILNSARERGIYVVEDACQAMMSRGNGRYLGTFGDIGCFSFGVTKLLTTGQGGMAVTSNKSLYERLKLVKFHGVKSSKDGWENYCGVGFNFKFADLLASIGNVQLTRAKEHVAHVCAIYRAYEQGLGNLPHVRVSPIELDAGEVPLWTEVETPNVEALTAHLSAQGIGTRRLHPPLHCAPHLAQKGEFPHATRFASNIMVLPSGPTQAMANVARTIEVVRQFAPQTHR